MPEVRIDVLNETAKSFEELSEHLARVQKEIRYLLGGNIDADNIIAKSITAGLINVDQLSAISANLGHITAGLIEAVTIYGSTIATSESDYPRAEMSNTSRMFRVATTPERYAEFNANWSEGPDDVPLPTLLFYHEGEIMKMGFGRSLSELMGISSSDILSLGGLQGIVSIQARVYNWDFLINNFTNKTMQEELNDLTSAINALASSVATRGVATGGAGSHNHGIPDGTQLMKGDGTTITWSTAGNHTHSQN